MTTFATPEPISINLELGVGDVRIVASDRTDTVVEVHPSDPTKPGDVTAVEQTQVDFSSGRLVIRGPKSWRQWTPFGGRESVDIALHVPSGSAFIGETGLAAVRAEGRLGEIDYRTGMGDLRLDEVAAVRVKTGMGDIAVGVATGDVDIKTATGRVEVLTAGGRAVIKNSNGDTHVGQVRADLRVQSANGRITVDRAGASVVAKTAFGDIRLGSVSQGTIEAHSAYGQMEIGVQDGVAAWLDLHTSFGQVRSDLDSTERPQPGEATIQVKAHTAMGDISIHRAPLVMSADPASAAER